MIYKCKKCGFKDITIGMQAHLVNNSCGAGSDYNLKTSDLKDYTTVITQKQFDKELQEVSMKAIKEKLANKKEVVEETEINKEGKKVTVKGKFEVQ